MFDYGMWLATDLKKRNACPEKKRESQFIRDSHQGTATLSEKNEPDISPRKRDGSI
jgi:hypothetical protein